MQAKSTRFLTQFSRAVFQQWTQTPAREQFWKDDAFLCSMLEEAVAKLPHGKLKTQLARDLTPLTTQLAALLRELHVEYVKKQTLEAARGSLAHGALLNEELTELELTQAAAAPTADKQRQVTGVLALDIGVEVAQHATIAQEQNAEQLVQLFARIAARNYESPREQRHKRGLVLQRLAAVVHTQVEKLAEQGSWSCDGEGIDGKQVQQLRALLERVVVQDAVALAGEVEVRPKAPWTAFYRPEESKELKKTVYDEEIAKIYGTLLALAVYYPVEFDEEEAEETSDDSSSDEEKTSIHKAQKRNQLSVLAQAQVSTRQVLLGAQMRQRGLNQSGQWLVSVLSFLQNLPKPARYLDEDEDETLDTKDQRALLDCLGQVYTRAFASVTLFEQGKESAAEAKVALEDRVLFEAVVCLRHAAHFMRVERKSSLPAITTAMAHLAGVPLPSSFVAWLDQEQTASPKSVLEKATQRLWKKYSDRAQMINMLLSSTDVTAGELPLIQKSYLDYLQGVAEGNLDKPSQATDADVSAATTKEAVADAASLFFMDNAGGKADEAKMSKSKKKRMSKKKRANKSDEMSPSKRTRASSN
ncbi:hypothetical protein PRIC2_001449 [Phytophthora ramorum]